MRTTIRLDDALIRQAKARAAQLGISLNDFISDAVRAAVLRRGGSADRKPIPVMPGGVLLPGVDLDDSAALLDLMEEAWPTPASAIVAEGPPATQRRRHPRK